MVAWASHPSNTYIQSYDLTRCKSVHLWTLTLLSQSVEFWPLNIYLLILFVYQEPHRKLHIPHLCSPAKTPQFPHPHCKEQDVKSHGYPGQSSLNTLISLQSIKSFIAAWPFFTGGMLTTYDSFSQEYVNFLQFTNPESSFVCDSKCCLKGWWRGGEKASQEF